MNNLNEGLFEGWSIKRTIVVVVAVIALGFTVLTSGMWVENIPAGEIVVIQHPIDGDLMVYTAPGMVAQNFGKITHYKKSFQLWFSNKPQDGTIEDQSIKVRFNDGGHAAISGSVRVDLPTSYDEVIAFHTKFGSQEAIDKELIRTVIEKSVYMSGPLMSSKQAYAETRNDLISYIEDQAKNGVYKTSQKDMIGKDLITGAEKTVTIVEIQKDKDGSYLRQEVSPVVQYRTKLYNLSINDVKFDSLVERQIATQQQAIMQVQTAIAKAKEAEQKTLTAEKEGEATAATAKWAQEAIKATEVTKAEQERDVQLLKVQTAEAYKKEQQLLGEGDGAYKAAVLRADGALSQKLDTYEKVMTAFATNMGSVKWVPDMVFGGAGGTGADKTNGINSFQYLMQMMSVKTANDLRLDMSVPAGATAKK